MFLFPVPCPHPPCACPGRPPRLQPGPTGPSPAPHPPKGGEGPPPSPSSRFSTGASFPRGEVEDAKDPRSPACPRQPPAALLRGKMLRSRHPLLPPRESGELHSVDSAALSRARGQISCGPTAGRSPATGRGLGTSLAAPKLARLSSPRRRLCQSSALTPDLRLYKDPNKTTPLPRVFPWGLRIATTPPLGPSARPAPRATRSAAARRPSLRGVNAPARAATSRRRRARAAGARAAQRSLSPSPQEPPRAAQGGGGAATARCSSAVPRGCSVGSVRLPSWLSVLAVFYLFCARAKALAAPVRSQSRLLEQCISRFLSLDMKRSLSRVLFVFSST